MAILNMHLYSGIAFACLSMCLVHITPTSPPLLLQWCWRSQSPSCQHQRCHRQAPLSSAPPGTSLCRPGWTRPPLAWAWSGRWARCPCRPATACSARAGTSAQTGPWRSSPCPCGTSTGNTISHRWRGLSLHRTDLLTYVCEFIWTWCLWFHLELWCFNKQKHKGSFKIHSKNDQLCRQQGRLFSPEWPASHTQSIAVWQSWWTLHSWSRGWSQRDNHMGRSPWTDRLPG